MRPCFKFIAAASAEQPATLSIYDEIGFWGVQAKDFISELAAVTAKDINVEINSPGGDVFAGLAIYNALRNSGKQIIVKVMGVAASAASLIAMAGDQIVMPKNTFMMIHKPWSFTGGNDEELRAVADNLTKIGDALQATYMARTGQTEAVMKEMLSKDTWMTADEALALGFATEVTDPLTANASFSIERADLPAAVAALFKPSANAEETQPNNAPPEVIDPKAEDVNEADVDPIADQVAARVRAAGLEDYLAAIALSANTVADADLRIASAREIVALCKVAGRPGDATAAINSNKAVADVRAALIQAKADDDKHTDTSKKSQEDTTASSSGVSPKKIWNSHNAQQASLKGRK